MAFLLLLSSRNPAALEYALVYPEMKEAVLMFKRSAMRLMSRLFSQISPLPVQHLPHSVHEKRLPLTWSTKCSSGGATELLLAEIVKKQALDLADLCRNVQALVQV